MGYRSDVYIRVAEHLKLPFNVIINKPTESEDKTRPIDALVKWCDYHNSDTIVFHSIKWYDGRPHIDLMMGWLDTLEDEDYGFIRIGEETTDVEQKGQPWEHDLEFVQRVDYMREGDDEQTT